MERNARQQLNELYQRTHAPPPAYLCLDAVRDEPPNQHTFVCNLSLAALPGTGFPAAEVQGEGRTKKAAQVCAILHRFVRHSVLAVMGKNSFIGFMGKGFQAAEVQGEGRSKMATQTCE